MGRNARSGGGLRALRAGYSPLKFSVAERIIGPIDPSPDWHRRWRGGGHARQVDEHTGLPRTRAAAARRAAAGAVRKHRELRHPRLPGARLRFRQGAARGVGCGSSGEGRAARRKRWCPGSAFPARGARTDRGRSRRQDAVPHARAGLDRRQYRRPRPRARELRRQRGALSGHVALHRRAAPPGGTPIQSQRRNEPCP